MFLPIIVQCTVCDRWNFQTVNRVKSLIQRSVVFGVALLCPSVSTVEVLTLKSLASKQPPFTSPLHHNQYGHPPAHLPTKNHALHYTLAQMYCFENSISKTIIKNTDQVRICNSSNIPTK